MWGACTPPSRACRQITGGNAVFAVALRAGLDAAGFSSTLVDCCDSHDFSFLSGLADHSSAFFKAVGALAVHEPLRNAESVPAAALATGKPIWSSESYTTCASAVAAVGWPSCDRDVYQLPAYPADRHVGAATCRLKQQRRWLLGQSDQLGVPPPKTNKKPHDRNPGLTENSLCFAISVCLMMTNNQLFRSRYVKGNLTRHMAWNLIQSYPTIGDGMNYVSFVTGPPHQPSSATAAGAGDGP
jgi:hypothetical protein